MFGQLKENILHNLDQAKNNPEELKTKFAAFTTALRENKVLFDLYEMYTMIETAKFDNEAIAKEFLDECLNIISSLQNRFLRGKNSLNALKPLAEGGNAKLSIITRSLDQLLFENTDLKTKYEAKSKLIKSLTDKSQKPDFKEMISTLDKKVNTQVSKLTTEQKEVLNLFLENDNEKIKSYYNNLIESTIQQIESRLLNEDSVDINKALIATKKRLQQLKEQGPSVVSVDHILDLKESLV